VQSGMRSKTKLRSPECMPGRYFRIATIAEIKA
jgi:hypothetical protein